MPDVLLAYSLAALLVAIVFAVTFFIGLAMRGGSNRTRIWLGLIGGLILAIALLEKAGWSTHHWTPGSPAEAFSDLIFRVLFLAGFGLLVVSGTAALGNRDRD